MLQPSFDKTFEYLKNQQKYNFHNFSNFIAIFCFLHSMIKQTNNQYSSTQLLLFNSKITKPVSTIKNISVLLCTNKETKNKVTPL